MNIDQTHNEAETVRTSQASGVKSLSWIAGALFILGIAVLAGFYWTSRMTVQKIQFQGHHFVSLEELQHVEIPTGISPDSMDFMKLIDRIEQIPYVKRADISVEPSGNLQVSITERKPLALLVDGKNKAYVDQDGLRLPLVRGKAVDVPILYGFQATTIKDTLKSESFKAVSDFLNKVKSRPVSDATISEVAWTDKDGVVALTNQNGVKLIFGKDGFDTRLRNWEAFYGEVVKEKGIEQMRSVDLRFRGQIVTREG